MNELATLLSKDQIERSSIEDLKKELSRTLKVTSEYLVYMSLIWTQLNKLGVDLSGLRSGLFEYVPLIAMNQLNPDLVIEFAGNKTLLSALARLPLEQQEWIAKTKQVPFVELAENQEKIERALDLTKAKASQIYQVFGGDSGFRNTDQQYALLVNRASSNKSKERKQVSKKKTYRTIGFDKDRKFMVFGDAKVSLDTVLERLSDLYNIDVKDILSKHTKSVKK